MRFGNSLYLLLLLVSVSFGINPSLYSNQSLTDLIEANHNITEQYESGMSFGDGRYKCVAIYTGEYRGIGADKLGFIRAFLSMLNYDLSFADYYVYEVRFEESDCSFWIPVQDNLIPYFEAEVSNDDAIVIYYTYLGFDHDSDEWIFLINDFETL